MRIMIHSNGPDVPTGYGNQVAILAPLLKDLGHDVAISAFYGAPLAYEYRDGIPVLPQGMMGYGIDVLLPHAMAWNADLIITLMDFWKLHPIATALRMSGLKIAPWIPIDCTPLGTPDLQTLQQSHAYPIAMSRHGQSQLAAYGWDAPYVPHAVDLSVFTPVDHDERLALKEKSNLSGKYVVGMVAANRDAIRKAFPEQLRAFASFHSTIPDSVMLLHTEMTSSAGHNLWALIEDLDIRDAVIPSDQYGLVTSRYGPEAMREFYGTIDVLMNASYGEGFGLSIVEANACGTPVIYTETSSMPEVASGYGVGGEQWYNPVHRAWWVRPSIKQLRKKLEESYVNPPLRSKYENHAEQFSITNAATRWADALATLEEA